jgi:hypothetical protein
MLVDSNMTLFQSAGMSENKEPKLDRWQIDDAFRLRALILAHIEKEKRRGIAMSQDSFMAQFGYSQGMMNMLAGKSGPQRPLNYDHVAMFAKALGVSIEEISPTLADRLLEMCKIAKAETTKIAVNQ